MRDGEYAAPRRELGDACSDGIHDTCDFRAGRKWKWRPDLILALDLQNVEEIQSSSMIANAHLPRSRLRLRDVVERHCLRFAPGMYAPGFHGLQVLAFGPNSAGSIRCAPSTHSHSSGRVSRGSIISTIPNASAVLSGERKRWSFSSISR